MALPLHRFDTVASTNDEALRLARGGGGADHRGSPPLGTASAWLRRPQRRAPRSGGRATGPRHRRRSAADNYSNLFESPVLFYAAILLTLILMVQDTILVMLAWTYVTTRYVHSFIHITYNRVMHRFSVFIFSSFVLFAIWVRLGWIIIQS